MLTGLAEKYAGRLTVLYFLAAPSLIWLYPRSTLSKGQNKAIPTLILTMYFRLRMAVPNFDVMSPFLGEF